MSVLENPQIPVSRTTKTWGSDQLLEVFAGNDLIELEAKALNLVRKKKVLDLFITPGVLTAKVQDEKGQLNKVTLEIQTLEDETWTKVYNALANTSYYPAKFLAGELPIEIEDIFAQAGTQLFPKTRNDIRILYKDTQTHLLNEHIVSVLLRVGKMLDNDPFTMLLWKGKGRDETIVTVRNLRREQKKTTLPTVEQHQLQAPPPPQSTMNESIKKFWEVSAASKDLEFDIKADELPAAILKWLDPLPLSGLEEKIEFGLEDAYARVARRSQAYGLGL